MPIQTPSVLAFERSLYPSDAVFSQSHSGDKTPREQPVLVREKTIRGTISNRLKTAQINDPLKLDAAIENANLQTVDIASLSEANDTLIIRYTLKALPFRGKPCACNNSAYQEKLLQTVGKYLENPGLQTLSRRYATNIANARWLWRNRLGAETIRIHIKNNSGDSVIIDNALDYNLNQFPEDDPNINAIAAWLEAGFRGQQHTLLHIEAHAKIGSGQETYPSQELVLDKTKDKSKILYRIDDQGRAGMHSQKIGNALRTIDDWYPSARFPIAAEPYGAVTTLGTAFRRPKERTDFYSLFDGWISGDQTPSEEQQHYLISILIRGGVFGKGEEKTKKSKGSEA